VLVELREEEKVPSRLRFNSEIPSESDPITENKKRKQNSIQSAPGEADVEIVVSEPEEPLTSRKLLEARDFETAIQLFLDFQKEWKFESQLLLELSERWRNSIRQLHHSVLARTLHLALDIVFSGLLDCAGNSITLSVCTENGV
jgi:hypothetical protein